MSDQLLVELLCLGYMALYGVLYASLFPSTLWLATLASCLAVKSLYMLTASIGFMQVPVDRWIVKSNIILILGHLVFGRLIDALAFALLGEVLLLNIQHKLVKQDNFRALWFCLLFYPELIPASLLLLHADSIGVPTLLSEVSGAFLGFEINDNQKSLGRQSPVYS